MRMRAAAMSDTGRVRGNNEDNYFVNGVYLLQEKGQRESYPERELPKEAGLFAICDGIGGARYGEISSYLAVSCLEVCRRSLLDAPDGDPAPILEEYIRQANRMVCQKNAEMGETSGGTTLTLLCLKEGRAYLYNLGDSRCYYFREGYMRQISEDHTVLQRMINIGMSGCDERQMRREGHTLTQYLGIPPEEMVIEPHEEEIANLLPGDLFLLCSDGLTDMVKEEEIERTVRKCRTCGRICESLISQALEAGGRDNVTVVAVEIE